MNAFQEFFITFLVTFFNALDFLKFFEFLSKILRRFFLKKNYWIVSLLPPHFFVGKHSMHKNCTSFISISFCLFFMFIKQLHFPLSIFSLSLSTKLLDYFLCIFNVSLFHSFCIHCVFVALFLLYFIAYFYSSLLFCPFLVV